MVFIIHLFPHPFVTSLSIENTALMATLQARSDEVRRLHADKMGEFGSRFSLNVVHYIYLL